MAGKTDIIRNIIKACKPMLNNMSLGAKRTGHDMLGFIKRPGADIKIHEDNDCPIKSEWFTPSGAPKDKCLMYIHGGSYETGSLASSRALLCNISESCRYNIFSIDYRLSPEYPFPCGLNDCQLSWLYLLSKGFLPQNIILIGDSAGGGMALALTMKLRDEDKTLPGAVICLSPWTDLTGKGKSHITQADNEILIDSSVLYESGLNYANGQSLKHPYISPVFGDFSCFPPVLIQVGSHEVLLSDSINVYNALHRDGAKADLRIFDTMWHVFQTFDVQESRQAIYEISLWIKYIWEDNI